MGHYGQILAERFYMEQAVRAECAFLYGDCGKRVREPRNPEPKPMDVLELQYGLLILPESGASGLEELALDELDSAS